VRRVRQWVAGWSATRRGAVGRWTFAAVAAALAVACVVIASLHLPKDDSIQAGAPVPAADLTVIISAADSCPALTASRLAGQLMATSAFKPNAARTAATGAAGIAGLSDVAWQEWAPGPQASRGVDADNILALAHEMCDLIGHARTAHVPGDAWQAALAAFHSGMPAVVAAKGVPADARGYVDAVNRYTAWYARQPGFDGASPATSAPSSRSPSSGMLSSKAAPSVRPSASPVLTSLTVTGTRALSPGESVQTDRTSLLMQTDGNLAIVDQTGTTRWTSNTAGTGQKAVFQDDGNFVVYDSQMKTLWSSRTDGHNGAVLVLQTNGDVCIMYEGTSLWCAGTAH
jgi:hypothetical protein